MRMSVMVSPCHVGWSRDFGVIMPNIRLLPFYMHMHPCNLHTLQFINFICLCAWVLIFVVWKRQNIAKQLHLLVRHCWLQQYLPPVTNRFRTSLRDGVWLSSGFKAVFFVSFHIVFVAYWWQSSWCSSLLLCNGCCGRIKVDPQSKLL